MCLIEKVIKEHEMCIQPVKRLMHFEAGSLNESILYLLTFLQCITCTDEWIPLKGESNKGKWEIFVQGGNRYIHR